MNTIMIETSFKVVDCPREGCGVVFAIGGLFEARRRNDGRLFHCPNGHGMSFGESESDRLRKELDGARKRLENTAGTITHLRDQRDAADRSARAQRAANTRLRKRVADGVCPCCRRSFANLGRHMAGQHPDFATVGGEQ